MLHCPACSSHLVHVGHVPVTFPLIHVSRFSNVLTCVNCAATTEVDEQGRLIDYLGLRLSDLYEYDCGLLLRLTDRSLQFGGLLFDGVES